MSKVSKEKDVWTKPTITKIELGHAHTMKSNSGTENGKNHMGFGPAS
jgi:hypothetical protein